MNLEVKINDEFISLSRKKNSFKHYSSKEKGIKKCGNAKQDYYNALMYNTEKTIEECRTQKLGDNMTTTKTSKTSLYSSMMKDFMYIVLTVILMIKTYIYSKDI